MNKRPLLVYIATFMTLGSGLVNLASLLGPSLPSRLRILEKIFPLEFIHISRHLTLIIGFLLFVSAVQIYKRKRRALQIVILLSSLSVLFHLSRGLDFEEASLSLLLLLLLVSTRKYYTVKSSFSSMPFSLVKIVLAVVIALSYGTLGFWYLEKKEFNLDFPLLLSLREAARFLLLAGDSDLIPQTRYARWFLDSLYVMSFTTLFYSIYALFRPIVYKFRTLPQERSHVEMLVKQYGRSAVDFFKYWPDKSYFFSESGQCCIAYGVSGKYAVALGDPVGPAEEIENTLRQFADFCRSNDWRIGIQQVSGTSLPMYLNLGLKKLKLGDDAIVDLVQFNIENKDHKQLRQIDRKLSELKIETALYDPPLSDQWIAVLKEISDEWLSFSHHRERHFTLGYFTPEYVRSHPVFTVQSASGDVFAFVNLIPSYFPGEITIDLMRRRKDAPNGIMEFLFIKLFRYLKEAGFTRFNLGMAPMAGFQEDEAASPEEKAIHQLFQHLHFLFSYRGLHHFKAKFASFWEPRYLIYENALELPGLALAIRALSES
jgi:phosphatidylglycerol lysyltransferase